MKNYVHLFNTASQFDGEYNGDAYDEPWLSYTFENEKVNYNKTEKEKLIGEELTFEVLSDGYINFKASTSAITKTVQYKKNDGEWTDIESSTGGTQIAVSTGDVVKMRGDNSTYATDGSNYTTFAGTTCNFNLKGNIMSLISSTEYRTLKTISSNYAFAYMFETCSTLLSTRELMLPATSISAGAYVGMFVSCTTMSESFNELPATTLGVSCYQNMLRGCTAMTSSVDVLPAATVPNSAYLQMFIYCRSLVKAPEILATSVGEKGCRNMFYQCFSLVIPPSKLDFEYVGPSGCTSMFYNCREMVNGPEYICKSSTTLSPYAFGSAFYQCDKLENLPNLPAMTLGEYCYWQMFTSCGSLVSGQTILPATTLAAHCYENMFYNCINFEVAPELPALTLAVSCYDNMFRYDSKIRWVKCLATDITASRCTWNWLANAGNSGTFVKNTAMSGWPDGGSTGIPTGWTVVDA